MKLFNLKDVDWKYVAIMLNIAYDSYSSIVYAIIGRNNATRGILIAVTVLIYVLAFANMKQKELFKMLEVYAIAAVFFGIQYMAYPENFKYVKVIIQEFAGIIPFCILLFYGDRNKLSKALLNAAYIIMLSNVFEPIIKFTLNMDHGYMIYGFRYIPASLIFTQAAIETKKVQYWFFAILTLLETLAFGNRSTLLVYLLFIALYVVFVADIKKKLKYFLGVGFGWLIVTIISVPKLIQKLADIFQRFGLSSRTLMMMINNEYTKDNGRDIVWEKALEYIKDKPWLGYGVGSDRRLPLASWNTEQYVHSIVFEMMLDFGVVIFIAICISLLVIILIRLLGNNPAQYKLLVIFFVSSSIPKLCVSGSFWGEPYFWYMLAILFSSHVIGTNKTKRNIVEEVKMKWKSLTG